MKVRFWGVRGFVPTPHEAMLRYGGNTCCTAVTGDCGELIVLDTGTGFCMLGDELMQGEFGRGRGTLTLLISHTYWDHILGLPFPGVVHIPGNRLDIYGPDSTRGSLQMVYDGMLSPVYSPVYGLAHIGATHRFTTISTEPFTIGRLTVRALPLSRHSHSPIWAYRLEEDSRVLVYITDVRYNEDRIREQAIAFARNAHVLIHSAPYLRDELVEDYGHSRIEDAIEVAQQAGVERLFIFHHAPTRTDDELDAIAARFRAQLAAQGSSLSFAIAAEGMELLV
ncbi:MAG: MBL fold metallo-hydrolase [Chloroflexus aggregans]|uniref:MBL fold metallo-hydrolase n=1 Tax=Chloroflexus aggregans TaxID=152260 RepID=A0A2J6XB31_9CHLR|nr:MAG: MBL fold metallo-hydrolase [Chloroflexus aggregans]